MLSTIKITWVINLNIYKTILEKLLKLFSSMQAIFHSMHLLDFSSHILVSKYNNTQTKILVGIQHSTVHSLTWSLRIIYIIIDFCGNDYVITNKVSEFCFDAHITLKQYNKQNILGITIYDIRGEEKSKKIVSKTSSDHQVISIFKQWGHITEKQADSLGEFLFVPKRQEGLQPLENVGQEHSGMLLQSNIWLQSCLGILEVSLAMQ